MSDSPEGALGEHYEDEGPTPGDCGHPWYDLDFLPDDGGLACSTCGDEWSDEGLIEGVVVVWNAAKTAIDAQGERILGLERLMEEHLGLARCFVCNCWGEARAWVDLGSGLCVCPDHVGDAVELSGDSRVAEHARDWVTSSGVWKENDLRGRWRWERNLLASPGLAEAAQDADARKAAQRLLVLPETLATKLGIPQRTTSQGVADALAAVIDVDPPQSRTGIAYLMGMLCETHERLQEWRRGNPLGEPDRVAVELIADEVSEALSPRDRHTRALVVSDIYGQSLDEEATMDSEICDGLLGMLGHRGAEAILLRTLQG